MKVENSLNVLHCTLGSGANHSLVVSRNGGGHLLVPGSEGMLKKTE